MENHLQQTLTQAADGLLFPSESDYPFEYFEWDVPKDTVPSEQNVRDTLNLPEGISVITKNLNEFFGNVTEVKDWYGEEETATVQQYVRLQEILEKELTDIRVFRVGEIEIDVYIVGRMPEKKWAGLKTKVVET